MQGQYHDNVQTTCPHITVLSSRITAGRILTRSGCHHMVGYMTGMGRRALLEPIKEH